MQFSMKKKNQTQFYCDYCHHWVRGDKKDITAHNASQKHRQKYQRELERKNLEAKRNYARMGYQLEEPDTKEASKSIFTDHAAEKREEK